MKILYITTVSSTINAFLVPHIKILINNGYKVDCACSINREVSQELIDSGVEVFDIPFQRSPLKFSNLKAYKRLIKIQKKNNYDIIHVHTPVAALFGRMLKIVFPNLKTIYTAHGYHFLKGGPKIGWILYYPIEKWMARFTDITINMNSEDFEITKRRLKPRKCYYVSGVGIDLDEYRQLSEYEILTKRKELELKSDDFIVIMIAELNENKNHIQLIKAMELLKDKYPNIKALIVGQGPKLNDLNAEVKNRGLEDNIIFLGFRKDINELINIADIGVLLSYREGLPRNLMELMANGRKIIATNIRGNRDIVESDKVGELVEIDDYLNTATLIEKNYKIKSNKFEINKDVTKYDIRFITSKLLSIYKDI